MRCEKHPQSFEMNCPNCFKIGTVQTCPECFAAVFNVGNNWAQHAFWHRKGEVKR